MKLRLSSKMEEGGGASMVSVNIREFITPMQMLCEIMSYEVHMVIGLFENFLGKKEDILAYFCVLICNIPNVQKKRNLGRSVCDVNSQASQSIASLLLLIL